MFSKDIIFKTFKYVLLSIIIAALTLFILRNSDDFHIILNINFQDLVVIMVLTLIHFSLLSYLFFIIVEGLAPHIPLRNCIKYFIVGGYLNHLIPQGGSIYRSLNFKLRDNVSIKKYISIHLFFHWINITLSVLSGMMIIYYLNSTLILLNINILFVLAILLMILILAIPALQTINGLISQSTRWKNGNKFFKQVITVAENFQLLLKSRKIILFSLCLVIPNICVGIGLLFFCFKSLSIDTTLAHLTLFFALIKIANLIQITPGNLGIREFLFGFLTNEVGIGVASGISVSIILRLVVYFVQGILSILFILWDKKAPDETLI